MIPVQILIGMLLALVGISAIPTQVGNAQDILDLDQLNSDRSPNHHQESQDYFVPFVQPLDDRVNRMIINTRQDSSRVQGSFHVQLRGDRWELMMKHGAIARLEFLIAGCWMMGIGFDYVDANSNAELTPRLYISGIIFGILFFLMHSVLMMAETFATQVRYKSGRKPATSWLACQENSCQWLVDMRDFREYELDKLVLKLSRDASIRWSIAFRDNASPANAHTLESDEFLPIHPDSLIFEMARGRKVFALKVESSKTMNDVWKWNRYLWHLTFELSKHASITNQLRFRHGGTEYKFPSVFLRISKTLKTLNENGWISCMLLPEHETEDDLEILNMLANHWEGITRDIRLSGKPLSYQLRLIQMVDYLMLERGLDEFLQQCLGADRLTRKERFEILTSLKSVCGNPRIHQKLTELWMV